MLAEIMRQPWPEQSKKGFWDLLPGKNPQKFLFLKPNPLIDTMLTQVSFEKYYFPEFWAYLTLRTKIPHGCGACPHFDQALAQPVQGPLSFLAPDIEFYYIKWLCWSPFSCGIIQIKNLEIYSPKSNFRSRFSPQSSGQRFHLTNFRKKSRRYFL